MTITTKRNLILTTLLALSVWAIVWGATELGKLGSIERDNYGVLFMFVILFGVFAVVGFGVALLHRIWTEAE
jgi:hypothetical protein